MSIRDAIDRMVSTIEDDLNNQAEELLSELQETGSEVQAADDSIDTEWQELEGQVVRVQPDATLLATLPDSTILDGRRTLAEVVAVAQGLRVHWIDPVRRLVEQGEAWVLASPQQVARDLAKHLAEGRAALRAGRLGDAEVSFEAAVQLSPDDVVARQNLRRVRQVRVGEGGGYGRWMPRR